MTRYLWWRNMVAALDTVKDDIKTAKIVSIIKEKTKPD